MRIVLMGKDFELRLVSLVVRARELAEEVLLLDLGSDDSTIEMAGKVACRVINHHGEILVPSLSKVLLDEQYDGCTLLINVNNRFRLRDMPLLVNRARENWDVHMSFISEESDNSNPQEIIYSDEYKVMKNVKIKGLMAMASNTNEKSIIRSEFVHAKKIFDEINNGDKSFEILSMGMSNDYKIAIECGSNMIRLGSLIFGERNY